MGFLAPLFLVGLAAIAVPVLVHLVNRERRTVVHFPSLMFLERVPHKSVRRRRIRNWALLALRCLAFAALATAFARPLVRRATATTVGVRGAREVVVLLDRSYSMSREGRWTRARQAARRVTDGLRSGDRATVVLFDESAEAATMPTGDVSTLRAAIDGASPGWGGTRYAPALRLAAKLLAESDRPRREVVLVSDLQRRAWEAREEVRLPDGASLAVEDVGAGDERLDAAVAQVTLRRDRGVGRDQLVAQARVTSTAACADERCGASRTVPVTLSLAGRDVETKSVTLPANGVATVSFAPVPVPAGPTRGLVRIPSDALARDDTARFVVSPSQELSILVLEPAGARANQSLYLRRALELSTQPAVRVDVRAADRATPADLDGRALVVLNDAAPRDPALVRRLERFVHDGGGLFAALGPRAGDVSAPLRALLAAVPGDVVDRGAEGGRLATLDLSHPALESFAAPRGGDFATARVLRYRAAQPAESAAVLARWDDGAAALVERHVGQGISLAWTSTLDTYWNDLALQPVWLPLMHRLARHAASFDEGRTAFTVGELLDARRLARGDASGALVAEAPSGARVPVGDSTHRGRAAVALREAGFWVLRPAGGAPGAGQVVAVNVDAAEADPARVEPETIVAAATASGTPREGRAALADLTAQEVESRQMLWWWFLAAAMLALAAELVVGNRLSKRMR
ncbi:MAG: BatA domain-containing protein [Gemmatimonadaceae bacterium]